MIYTDMRAKNAGLDKLSRFLFCMERCHRVCAVLQVNPETVVHFMILISPFVQLLHGGTGRGSHVG